MSEATTTAGAAAAKAPAMNLFERYLTLWVALCIVAGIGLGQAIPAVFHAIGAATVAEVNLPVAVLIWLMIVPMLLKIDPAALGQVGEHWRGVAVTVGVNWLVKPFSMALLGWLFIAHLFRPFLPADQIDAYIAGLILLAAAPCTAMVFVWSNLVEGEPHFTLSQVALNDTIMIVAFAPIVALLLGLSSIVVPWNTLLLSVALYIALPVIAAQLWRRALLAQGGQAALGATLRALNPLSLSALLLTLVLLFGLQGEQIVRQPLVIGLLAVPILIQVYFNAGLAYLARSPPWRRMVRRRAFGADRGEQFLRIGGRDGDRAVRIPIRRGAGDGGRRPRGSAGHAVRRPNFRRSRGWVRRRENRVAAKITCWNAVAGPEGALSESAIRHPRTLRLGLAFISSARSSAKSFVGSPCRQKGW